MTDVRAQQSAVRYDGRPQSVSWAYDRGELRADCFVHLIALALAPVAVFQLVDVSRSLPDDFVRLSVRLYGAALLTALVASTAYNLCPISRLKWILRRFDQSAVFFLIAASYTPFVALLKAAAGSGLFLAWLWGASLVGAAQKLYLPGRFDRLSLVGCLLLGWSGILMYEQFAAGFSRSTLVLIGVGGLFYSVGAVFFVWERLRFQHVIWHVFALAGASCHYAGVLTSVSNA
jgi:hemolysin III